MLALNLFTTEWNGKAVRVFLTLYTLVFIHIYFIHNSYNSAENSNTNSYYTSP
jgi:hypothetical protein